MVQNHPAMVWARIGIVSMLRVMTPGLANIPRSGIYAAQAMTGSVVALVTPRALTPTTSRWHANDRWFA
jgi:hypothetical protein